jgi:hypothetical protein
MYSWEYGHPEDIETERSPISSSAMVLVRDIARRVVTEDLRYYLRRPADRVSADPD